MGLFGVARANTAVGVSPETFLLLLLLHALPLDTGNLALLQVACLSCFPCRNWCIIIFVVSTQILNAVHLELLARRL
jgi:hypothetical protein